MSSRYGYAPVRSPSFIWTRDPVRMGFHRLLDFEEYHKIVSLNQENHGQNTVWKMSCQIRIRDGSFAGESGVFLLTPDF